VVLSVVMTDVSNAVSSQESCKREPDSCATTHDEYLRFLVANRALVTALVTIYAMVCVISNGLTMVYSFFLARKCRKQPTNWLTASTKRLSHRPTLTYSGPVPETPATTIV
jgi:hypothetical protein